MSLCFSLPYQPERRRRVAYALAFAVTSLTLLIGSLSLVLIERARLQEKQETALMAMDALLTEARDRLLALHAAYPAQCAPDNLRQLRAEILGNSDILEIGLFNRDGRLACSTSLGVLETPYTVPKADAVLMSDGTPLQFNFDIELLVREHRLQTVVVQYAAFNLVYNPALFDRLLAEHDVDLLFYADRKDRIFPIRQSADLSAQRRAELMQPQANNGRVRGDGSSGLYYLSRSDGQNRNGHTGFQAGSVLDLHHYLQRHRGEVILLMALSTILGFIIAYGIGHASESTILRRRVPSLLKKEHLVCLYQPIVDLHSGRIVGCEVLSRLRDGRRLLSPDQFLPVIIAKRLTWHFDALVTTTALAELRRLNPCPDGLRVALNYFPDSLVFERLNPLLYASGIDPVNDRLRINLEILEYYDDANLARNIEQFKKHGYLISIDDFGTGYANLHNLHKIRPDFLKIDQSFIRSIQSDSIQQSLIPDMVSMARTIEAKTIAEHIEDAHQLDVLKQHGVDYGQGFYFAPPLPLEEFAARLKAQEEN